VANDRRRDQLVLANGVRVLQALDLRAAAERNAAVVRRWAFFDQHGAALCQTDLEGLVV
jgi:hypothetical protein